MYTLNQWGVRRRISDNPYLAPECNPVCLVGFRDDDPRQVLTSPIVEVNGKIIKTYSGSTYCLGEPNPEYIAYLESIGYDYDEENPIKDMRK